MNGYLISEDELEMSGNRRPSMQKWEYKKITIEDTWDGKSTHVKYIDDKLIGHKTENCPRWDTAYLQELGAQGWEMVLCQNHTHYFKRPIEE